MSLGSRTLVDFLMDKKWFVFSFVVLVILIILLVGFFSYTREKKAETAAFYLSKGIEAFVASAVSRASNATLSELMLNEALNYFEKAKKEGAGEARLADFLIARVLMEMGKSSEAQSILNNALSHMSDGDKLKPIFLGMGADEELFVKYLSSGDSPFMEAYVRYMYAVKLLSDGKVDEAKRQLMKIKDRNFESFFAKEAQTLLEEIE